MCIHGGIDIYVNAHMRLVIWNMQGDLENLQGWKNMRERCETHFFNTSVLSDMGSFIMHT